MKMQGAVRGMNERAMTADGYIKDQDYTDDIPYGYWPSSFNGCGWIAVFNYMHGMGMPDTPEEVYAEMLRILPYEGRRGTPFPTMAEFFRKRGIPASRHYGQKGLLRKADGVPAGIVRYVERGEPHYVAFVRTGEGRYRFLRADFSAQWLRWHKDSHSHHGNNSHGTGQ